MTNPPDYADTPQDRPLRGIAAQTRNMKLAARSWALALYYTLLRPLILLLPSRPQAWCFSHIHKARSPFMRLLRTEPAGYQPPPAVPVPGGLLEGEDDQHIKLITIIGRGHSGTRAMSHTLSASGVFMGDMVNDSGDLLPAQDLYDACRMLARHVVWKGELEWDFSRLRTMPIPEEFRTLIHRYLESVRRSKSAARGWKLPETTLVYPWIVRMFPEVRYIFWIRDPRDCILGKHLTDDLADFGVQYPETDDVMLQRAISWKYQYDIVKATPRPAKWIEVRFEDFVLEQEETLARLEEFLGMDLGRIIVRPDAVGRWKQDKSARCFDFFAPAMDEYHYPAAKPA
ncbi:MAG: sulfotransferase family protein [Candidatus Brocadiia bacterium]